MPFKASRGFAIGLFACVYGIAKWSDSAELRYLAMIFSVMLLAVTLALKWWNKRQNKISSDPLSIPGPRASDVKSGNLGELAKCGSLHEYIKRLSHIYGPIGSFFWGNTKIAYISSQRILSDNDNKELLQNLDRKPLFLYQGLKPLIGLNSIQFANSNIYHLKMKNVFHKIYTTQNIYKLIYNQYKIIENDIINEWIKKLNRNNKEKAIDIDIETDLFAFTAKSVLYSIFGVYDKINNDELITQIMDNYNICYDEMEQRLVYGSPPDHDRKQKFEKSLKNLKYGITKILDITSSSKTSNNDNLVDFFKENKELYPNQECILDEIITIINGIYKMYYGILWISYFIAKHNDIQNKIIDEIGSIFGRNNDDEKEKEKEKEIFDDENKSKQYMEKLMQLKYSKNVIKESLRMTSIVSWTARVSNDGDIILNTLNATKKKVKIPQNMPIIIGLGAINTEKKQWGNPYTFKPDRFGDSDNDINLNIFGGLGNRMCPGHKLFQTQALMFIVNVLSKFELRLKEKDNSTNPIHPIYGLLTKPNKTIDFKLSKRQFAML